MNDIDSEVPLANPQLEQELLGSLLAENSGMNALKSLKTEHFDEPVHQRIFEVLSRWYGEGRKASPATIRHFFEQDNALKDIGGGSYLNKIAAGALVVMDLREHEREIISLWRRRKLLESYREGIRKLLTLEDNQQPEEIAAELVTQSQGLLNESDCMRFKDDYQVSEQILEDLKSDRKPCSTGIPILDEAMDGGLYPGKAYGFAARKKIGKTILAGTIAANLNLAKEKHLFICAEMGDKEIHQRTLARLANQFPSGFRTAYGKSQHFQTAIATAAVTSSRCTFYLNAPGITFAHLRRACSAAAALKGVKGIILDYWQLVGGRENKQNPTDHLDNVAQWIAEFCRKNQVWAIVMAQINQEGNTRGGEGIRLAFDQVYQIHAQDDDPSTTGRWIEMLDTRYTPWMHIGSKESPRLQLNPKGPYFEQIGLGSEAA